MPFITPLLCVAARYGSISARAAASTMARATSAPGRSPVLSASAGMVHEANALRRSARLLRMRRFTRPPVSASTVGASCSQTVLIALAPIASRTSNRTWITSIGPAGVSGNGRSSRPRAPPPSLTMTRSQQLASSNRRSRASHTRPAAA